MQLWIQVLIAMLAGVVLGIFNPSAGTAMQPLGDGFIRLIKMLIAPIIFCTIVLGITKMNDMSKLGRVAIKTIICFEVFTTVALILALVVANIWQPGKGMNVNMSGINTASLSASMTSANGMMSGQGHGIVPFLMNIMPATIVGALADGNILQVLFISVLFGCALLRIRSKCEALMNVIEAASKLLFCTVDIVMWTASLGAFGAIAFTVGKFGVTSLWSLGSLLGCMYTSCILYLLLVLWPVAMFIGVNFFKLMRYLWEETIICLATTSSEVVLPRLLQKLEKVGCKPGILGLVIPAGYSFNLTGTCLYLTTSIIFLAQATNTPMTLTQQIGIMVVLLLTSKGAACVSGAAFVVLTATLSAVSGPGMIPVASVALILGVHRLLSEGMTPVNMISNSVMALVISKSEKGLDMDVLHRVLDGKDVPELEVGA
jgi:aerobic C4-dicarboxylate transport protein